MSTKKNSVKILKGKKDNYKKIFTDLLKNNKCLTVAIVADWCGHCQNLKPLYETAYQKVNCNKGIECVYIETTLDDSKIFLDCIKYDVKGYPTILRFHDGKLLDEYNGKRHGNNENEKNKCIDEIATFMCGKCNNVKCNK
jgi:thiol-disulfide isomerase/thioredoxin